jgi:hypothetical protein
MYVYKPRSICWWVSVTMTSLCVSDAMVRVCMSRCVCVCVSFQLLSFKLSSGCLFRPHHVHRGGVQKSTPQVTPYEPPHCWRVSQETQKWQAQPGAAWPSGPSEGTRARAACTTPEGLCQGALAALSCRHLARTPHGRHRHPWMYCHSRVGIKLGLHTVDIDIHHDGCTLVAWDFSLTDCPPALAFLPASPSPILPFARFAGITTVSESASRVSSPRVAIKRSFFKFFFWGFFS